MRIGTGSVPSWRCGRLGRSWPAPAMEEGKQREQRRARGGGGEEDECGGWILYIGAVVWVGESEAFIEVLRSSRPSVGLGSPTEIVFVEAHDQQTKGFCPLGC
jgi:hypothetical protein